MLGGDRHQPGLPSKWWENVTLYEGYDVRPELARARPGLRYATHSCRWLHREWASQSRARCGSLTSGCTVEPAAVA